MERAIILSDTHLMTYLALNVIKFESENKRIDRIVHLGDMVEDAQEIEKEFPNIKIDVVAGNCDFNSPLSDSKVIEIGGKKFYITHGDAYEVKAGLDRLINISDIYKRRCNVEAVLFGHTHIPYSDIKDGVLYFNPGTAGDSNNKRTYGIIEVEGEKINANIFDI